MPRASPVVASPVDPAAVCRNARRTRQVPSVSRNRFLAGAVWADEARGDGSASVESPIMDCGVVSPIMLVSPMMLSLLMVSTPMLVESPIMLSAEIRLASPIMLASPMMLTSPIMEIAAVLGATLVTAQRDAAARTWPVTNRFQVASSIRPDGRAGSPLAISSDWVAVSGLNPAGSVTLTAWIPPPQLTSDRAPREASGVRAAPAIAGADSRTWLTTSPAIATGHNGRRPPGARIKPVPIISDLLGPCAPLTWCARRQTARLQGGGLPSGPVTWQHSD